jgi:hypothetical protein
VWRCAAPWPGPTAERRAGSASRERRGPDRPRRRPR